MIQRPLEVVKYENQKEAPVSIDLSGCRILLAEDRPENQELDGFVLRKYGAEVKIAANGREAIDSVLAADGDQPFDAILMDMQMPVLDGYASTRILRKRGYTTPIIALTAHAMIGDREKCLAAGCDDHVSKPIDTLQLLGTIARLVRDTEEPIAQKSGLQNEWDGLQTPPQESDTPVQFESSGRAATGPSDAVVTGPGNPLQHTGESKAGEPANELPIDFDALLRRCLGNQTLAESLLQKFQIRVESDFEQLELGIATGDADAVRKLAHGLKGAAANLSAEGVRRAAARLELLADENDLGEAIVCLEVLKLEWDRCQIFMPTLVQLS